MSDARRRVVQHYTDAIEGTGATVVAGTGGARFAAYSRTAAASSPDLMQTSFGCGDPVAFSQIAAGQTVLDLGCGAGLDLILAARRVGPTGRVIGVDASHAMLERARATISAGGYHTIEVRLGAIESLPVATASVDWVISNCVINLSHNKERVFREIARVLKPGGHMLVSDIVADRLPYLARRSGLLRVACVAGAIPEERYLQGLKAAGLNGASVLARRYYEPAQMAAVVIDVLPRWIGRLRCCGRYLATSFFSLLARRLAKRLWSARISATRSCVGAPIGGYLDLSADPSR